MTTPDDRSRPGPHPGGPGGGPGDAPSAPPTWSVGDRPAAAPGYAPPAGTASDDLDAPAPTTAARPAGRRGEGLLVAALFTAAGAVLVLALAVGALAVAVGLGGGRDLGPVGGGPDAEAVVGAETYGDDPVLDDLWDACDAGDGDACDDLFYDTDGGTEYEEFGWTCGGRFDTSREPGTCPAELG